MTLAAFLRHLGFAALLILLSAATVRMMISVRVMDTPAARKVHDRPTPKGGGVGIVVTFLIGIAVLYQFAAFSRLADPYFRGVIEASVAIAVVAFLDDLPAFGLRGRDERHAEEDPYQAAELPVEDHGSPGDHRHQQQQHHRIAQELGHDRFL